MSSRLLNTIARSNASQISKKLVFNSARTVLIPKFSSTFSFISKSNYSTASVDNQLKEVLKSELKISNTIPNELDTIYTDYLDKSKFKVVETEGNSNVELVKESENEIIRIYFDIDEVTDVPIQEETIEGEENINEEIGSLDSLLCNVKVLIENPSKKDGLFLNLFLQNSESSFLIDFANYKPSTEEFLSNQVAKGEFADKFQYQGPRFSDLDESLQASFENYLDAKGINEELAEFIISYSEFKEEKEYRNWLTDLTKYLN